MTHAMSYEEGESTMPGPLRMGSRTDEDVLHEAHPEHEVHEGSAASNQRFTTNPHPEGLDDGADSHGSKVVGPKPG